MKRNQDLTEANPKIKAKQILNKKNYTIYLGFTLAKFITDENLIPIQK